MTRAFSTSKSDRKDKSFFSPLKGLRTSSFGISGSRLHMKPVCTNEEKTPMATSRAKTGTTISNH